MKPQKQLFKHDPKNGVYGDCFRTCLAVVLDLDAAEVPHFMHGSSGVGSDEEAHDRAEAWLRERGYATLNFLFEGKFTPAEVMDGIRWMNSRNTGALYLLAGESKTGVNHNVVCANGEIVCDPSQNNSGIKGPCDDGWYWATFLIPANLVMSSEKDKAA